MGCDGHSTEVCVNVLITTLSYHFLCSLQLPCPIF